MVKLEGSVMGTFQSIASTVKDALTQSLMKLLTPKRRVDILRDVLDANENQEIQFLSDQVGKSTNLAKICFWLIENKFTVLLIAACDTFRAINHARDSVIDMVLVDTAGMMQDNEPLMRALSKIISVRMK